MGEFLQLITMKDKIMVLRRESRTRLLQPVHRRETGNDKSVLVRNMLNGTQHGPGFAGLGKRNR